MSRRKIGIVLLTIIGIALIAVGVIWLHSRRIADRSILTDSICAAPCWQGITPGTSIATDEVVQLLETMPSVNHIWINETTDGVTVLWFWRQWPWRQSGYNSIYREGGVVHNISLSIDFSLTVREVIDKYGIPETTYVTTAGAPENSHGCVNLIYPTKGLWFRAMVPLAENLIVEPSTKVFEIVYIVPAQSLEEWRESLNTEISLQPWSGYGELNRP